MASTCCLFLSVLIAFCSATTTATKHHNGLIQHHWRLHKYGHDNARWFAGATYDADDADNDESEGGEAEKYSDKEQLTAFLLSFFLGWTGAGRFYVGDYAVASIKLCMPLIICCVTAILLIVLKQTDDVQQQRVQQSNSNEQQTLQEFGGAAMALCICSCGFCAMYIWYMVDWIMFAMNEIPDAHGKTLYPM